MRKNAMALDFRACKIDELSFLLEQLDQEFIFSKKRCLSLSKRFPNTLSEENIEHMRVAMSDGVMCGAYVIRLFNWVTGEHSWHGAMVGMVWVDQLLRGKGIGAQLMVSATRFLHEKEVDFGVLWTGRHAFYERAGWVLSDRSLFGEVVKNTDQEYIGAVACRHLTSIDPSWLEDLRCRRSVCRVMRSTLDYCTVPIPADRVFCFSAKADDGSEGFALVGEQGSTGYLYEMVASPVLWAPIWTSVVGHFVRLFVNGYLGDPFSQWLGEKGYVVWHPQNKTMWFNVSARINNSTLNNWHISYFDWI
jgi:hypothetical protein